MKYRNTKTGVTVTVASRIIGGDWVEVVATKPRQTATKAVATAVRKATSKTQTKPSPVAAKVSAKSDGSFENTTVKQIKQELDAMGIKYSQNAKKQELYDLMMGK